MEKVWGSLNNDERKEINLSKLWLRTCLDNHDTCRAHQAHELHFSPHADDGLNDTRARGKSSLY
jgi:hypothetical protein